MVRILRGLTLAIALLGGGLLAAPALASEAGVMKVADAGNLFTTEGVEKAKSNFEGTTFKSKTHLLVVTAGEVPDSKQAEFKGLKDQNDRSRFFENWAREEGKAKDRKGDIVVLIYMDGKRYWTSVITDEQADVYRSFTDAKAKNAAKVFNSGLKTILDKKLTGDAAKKESDAALLALTRQVIEDLKDTSAPETKTRPDRAVANVEGGGKGSGIMGWVCIGLCVLAGVWFVSALFRALMGGGGGGGYGGGGGGFGGGGGGGFFPSLLGGMFGAAAGMWLYDSFTGGHHGSYGSDAAAADGGGDYGDTGDGNYDSGAAGGDGGGDWGGGGDDFGGGGGDWGGGGDFGGGGDW